MITTRPTHHHYPEVSRVVVTAGRRHSERTLCAGCGARIVRIAARANRQEYWRRIP